ncbi:hypothetical protein NMY22_g17730 [Coprinellus aureogranulatus]|nr:hypothetical protein NMY22_g17730 [Coprinellus aureogranulatus]
MSFNNAPLIKAIDQETTPAQDTLPVPPIRRRVVSEPCLPERLPNTSFLQREAESLAPTALRKELARNDPGPKESEPENDIGEIPPLQAEDKSDEQSQEEPPQSPTESERGKSSFFKTIAKTITGFNATLLRR